MIRQFTILAIAGLGLGLIAPPRAAQAEEFRVVDSDARFVSLIEGRELRRLGIRLTVTPTGEIEGRAFGGPVTGQWRWENGYFCRDLFWNDTELGYNCQLVQENGATIRFTSDQGSGMFADLTLE